MLDPHELEKLDGIATTVAKIDERTHMMQSAHKSDLDAAHARITEVKADLLDDIADVRKEARKVGGTAGGILGAVGLGLSVAKDILFGRFG